VTHYDFDLSLSALDEIQRMLQGKISLELNIRDRLNFLEEYMELVTSGRKKTTIRFRRGMIDCPVDNIIPVFSTTASKALDQNQELGWAQILNLRILPFRELDEIDAINDGFLSLNELRNALIDIYGEIDDSEFVSVYEFDYLQNK